ncbi:hypothetical protein BKA82DRAFT_725231 [Pisolithus tinctorius]|nr:hypothetical protein BKA82DRAFT_725231 [Pisolithus tinctorius]
MSRITDRRLLYCFHFQRLKTVPPSSASVLTRYSQELQSPSRSTTPALLLVPNFSLVGRLDEEQDNARVELPLEYISGENGSSSIASHVVNQCSDMQDRTSSHHEPQCSTFLPAHKHSTTLCYRTIVKISTGNRKQFNIWGSRPCLRRTYDGTELCNPSLHDHTAGLVFGSNAPRSWLPSGLSPCLHRRRRSATSSTDPNRDCGTSSVPFQFYEVAYKTNTPVIIMPGTLSLHVSNRIPVQLDHLLHRRQQHPVPCPSSSAQPDLIL